MVEEMRYKELEAGAERKVRNNQNEKLVDQSKIGSIKVKDEIIRATNARTSVMDKLKYDREYQDRLQTMKRENEVIHKGVLEYRTDMHERQLTYEAQTRINKEKRNPFIAKVNRESMERATKYKEEKELKTMMGNQSGGNMLMTGRVD